MRLPRSSVHRMVTTNANSLCSMTFLLPAIRAYWLGIQPYCHHLDIGHIFHGESDTLASQSTLAVAAIGHVIGAEVGRVIDNHAAKIQASDRLEDAVHIPGEYTDLQTVLGIVGLLQ